MLKMTAKLPENSLTIDSTGGMVNRMLALQGAIPLGRELGKRVYLNWQRSATVGCGFNDLFEEPGGEFEVLKYPVGGPRPWTDMVRQWNARAFGKMMRKLPHNLVIQSYRFDASLYVKYEYANWPHGWPYGERWLVGMLPMSELKAKNRIYIHTYYDLYRALNPAVQFRHYDYVRPVAMLRERIDEVSSQFDGNTIGVHIRHGDADPLRRIHYPMSEFVRLMREEIRLDAGVRFYLSTDSDSVAARLSVLFGSRIMMQPGIKRWRSGVYGMQCAVVDLWALSRTRKIIGSFWSTFSEMASQIGQVELHTVDVLKPGFKAGGGGG